MIKFNKKIITPSSIISNELEKGSLYIDSSLFFVILYKSTHEYKQSDFFIKFCVSYPKSSSLLLSSPL